DADLRSIVRKVVVKHHLHGIAEASEVGYVLGTSETREEQTRDGITVGVDHWSSCNGYCGQRFGVSRESHGSVLGTERRGREQRVVRSFHVEGSVLQVVHLFEEIRPLRVSFLQRLLEACGFGLCRGRWLISGNNFDVRLWHQADSG